MQGDFILKRCGRALGGRTGASTRTHPHCKRRSHSAEPKNSERPELLAYPSAPTLSAPGEARSSRPGSMPPARTETVANHQAPSGLRPVLRMWVKGSVRGLGLGRRILETLEEQAREYAVHVLRLDTNRTLKRKPCTALAVIARPHRSMT